jgi:dihydrofolate reductase
MSRNVIASMSVSVDGFIAGPDGDFGWSVPDDELHRFHNEQVRQSGVHLLGRRLYETMVYWETADEDPALGATMREFAAIWKALPKIVFSTTLDAVVGNARLLRGGVAEVIAELKAQPGGDIAVGGAGLVAGLAQQDLVDEYRLFVCPIVVGGGTPYFPALGAPIPLELAETRTFGSRVVYLRYRRPLTSGAGRGVRAAP